MPAASNSSIVLNGHELKGTDPLKKIEVYRWTPKEHHVLQQAIQMERKMYTKQEAWGDALTEEAKRRNTVMLYAVTASLSSGLDTFAQVGVPAGNNQLLGYLLYATTSCVVHIRHLAVCKNARRQGIATQLLYEALRRAVHERRSSCATLYVRATNIAALRLYVGLGFHTDAVLEDYYAPGKHAHRMIAQLCDAKPAA